VLHSENAEFAAIVLSTGDGDGVRVIGEVVGVLG